MECKIVTIPGDGIGPEIDVYKRQQTGNPYDPWDCRGALCYNRNSYGIGQDNIRHLECRILICEVSVGTGIRV